MQKYNQNAEKKEMCKVQTSLYDVRLEESANGDYNAESCLCLKAFNQVGREQ